MRAFVSIAAVVVPALVLTLVEPVSAQDGGGATAVGLLESLFPIVEGLVGGSACYFGYDPLTSCVCSADRLREAVDNNESNINLCFGTIVLNEPLDITGKDFTMGCQAPFIFNCEISGGSRTRIFQGSPIEVTFGERIRLVNGNASGKVRHDVTALFVGWFD